MLASEWNIPIFDFVGQTAKLENNFLYDTYVRLVPPMREIGDVLQKSLQYLGWKHIGMFGGPSGISSWDRVDELWRVVENELKSHFTITAQIKYTTNDPALLQENLRTVSATARGKWKGIFYCLYLERQIGKADGNSSFCYGLKSRWKSAAQRMQKLVIYKKFFFLVDITTTINKYF